MATEQQILAAAFMVRARLTRSRTPVNLVSDTGNLDILSNVHGESVNGWLTSSSIVSQCDEFVKRVCSPFA